MDIHLFEKVKANFRQKFHKDPEIVIFSPGRINFIGEHTDYNDGFVFPAAIDKGIVAAISKSDKATSSILALDVDEKLNLSLQNLKSIENGEWKNYVIGVVSEIQKKGKSIGNFSLVFAGNIPLGSGLSSSAALENSVVFALNELFSLSLTKKEMIFISQQAEHNFVGVKCGIMDQYASMFGLENSALLLDCRNLVASSYAIDFNNHEIILVNTNVKHSLAESAYNDRRAVCEKTALLLNVKSLRDASENKLLAIKDKISKDDYQKALYVIQENNRVLLAVEAIENNALTKLGQLLFESHQGLQEQYKVSCPELDFLVDAARENPAILGARMMGGGFGGCTINIIRKDMTISFIDNISKAYREKFGIECTIISVKLVKGTHSLNDY